MTISNEAIEAAARSIFAQPYESGEWDTATSLIQERYRYIARTALDGACWIIRAAALDEAANEFEFHKKQIATFEARKFNKIYVAKLRARAVAERGRQ